VIAAGRIAAAVGRALGRRVTAARQVAGGDINEAWAVRLDDGEVAFLKTRTDAAPGEFATEAAGLAWLAEAGARVPEVLAVHDEPPRFLALAWIDGGRLDAAGEVALGRELAALHAAGAPAFGAPPPVAPAGGLRLGALELPAATALDWPAFYAEHRLLALLPHAGLDAAGRRAVEAVAERMDELAGPPEPPARLHGDLWSGNVLAGADGRARLIDPAAHGGHREVDLAMLRLFGAPSERVFAAYEEAAPLAEGHRERIELWQLFPLLVHAALFGGSYGASVERAAVRYVT
jgi:fructosamine-3-kinase